MKLSQCAPLSALSFLVAGIFHQECLAQPVGFSPSESTDKSGYQVEFADASGTSSNRIRVSTTAGGGESDGRSFDAAVSDNGDVVYTTLATNLTNITVMNSYTKVVLRRPSGVNVAVGEFDSIHAQGSNPSIDAAGRYVAFASVQDGLSDDDLDPVSDIFLFDSQTGVTQLVSRGFDGTPADDESYGPLISPDGNWIAFSSDARNLISVDLGPAASTYLYNIQTEEIQGLVASPPNNPVYLESINQDASRFAFKAANSVDGQSGLPFFSYTYQLGAPALEFLADDVNSFSPQSTDSIQSVALSNDGASALVLTERALDPGSDFNGDYDAYLISTASSQAVLISRYLGGDALGTFSSGLALSLDGDKAIFQTSNDFLPQDTNLSTDLFLVDTNTLALDLLSFTSPGVSGDGASSDASFSPNGRYIVFQSSATNLVPGVDSNGVGDIFLVTRGRTDLAVELGQCLRVTRPGAFHQYEITVSNLGGEPASNVQVSNGLPAGVDFHSSIPACDAGGACSLGTLQPGASASISFLVFVDATAPPLITLQSSVTSDAQDETPGNNSATINTTVIDDLVFGDDAESCGIRPT